MPNGLPLNGIVDINVTISPSTIYRKTFDTALILGDSTKITTQDRVKSFTNLDEMTDFGFLASDPEYKAAALYFAQKPRPYKVFVGVKDVGETILQAATACRNANFEWYVLIPTDDIVNETTDVDLLALCDYVESAKPETLLALSLTKVAYADTLIALKAGSYQRTISQYDNPTLNVNNAGKTCIAGIIGYAMGKNKPNVSSFNLAYKNVIGLDSLAVDSDATLNTILDSNGNVYLKQGYYYNIFRQGKMASGDYFDEILGLDMLVNELRTSIMQRLIDTDKIPQTENGINVLVASISNALDVYVANGFVSPGPWLGEDILELKTGDTLSSGYLIQFDSIISQSPQDRINRIAPTCYVAIKLAGAIEHVVLGINVSK